MKTIHRGEKGFTLIELLIVIAILGIIAAVVIPNISGFMASGNLAAANSEAEQVKTACLGYYADHSAWPTDSSQLPPTYITGTLKAVYDIDPNCGWLYAATAVNGTGWPSTIVFQGGAECDLVNNVTGQHGTWQRAAS
jgi:prepilin-type N-terminal cleavage/methylation domain-containing protein